MESEIFREIKEEIGQKEETCEEGLLFPKEEWNSLIHWRPVSNIPVEEIYKDLPEVKQFHDSYVKMWNLRTKNKER